MRETLLYRFYSLSETSTNPRTLAVVICVTNSYNYALTVQARHVLANLAQFPEGGHIIFATDSQETVSGALAIYEELGSKWKVHVIARPFINNDKKNYKATAQLTIAQMRQAVFDKARALNADFVWSLDSDVLPPANALRCMLDALSFDSGYYSVATCPYISHGGGGWLFGRGTPHNWILPNAYDDELDIPEDLQKESSENLAQLKEGERPSEEWIAKQQELIGRIRQSPHGNVFKLNAKGWRKRGWGEYAYPAIGKGAIVPTDWFGWGCTLINRKALNLTDFTGYYGNGTEDLFIGYTKYWPAGLHFAAITHAPCHHVIRKKGGAAGYVLMRARHETEGECLGHLRCDNLPFLTYEAGETLEPENDGILIPSPALPTPEEPAYDI